MSRVLIRTGVAALSTAVAFGSAAAFAQTYDRTDATGDVYVSTYDSNTEQETGGIDPAQTRGDVQGLDVSYTKRRFIAVIRLADSVVEDGDTLMASVVAMRGRWSYEFTGFVLQDAGEVAAFGDFTAFKGARYKRSVKCKRLRVSHDAEVNTLTMTAPSSCVRSSRSVRLASYAVFEHFDLESEELDTEAFAIDDALSDTLDFENGPVVSGILKRGGAGVVTDPAPAPAPELNRTGGRDTSALFERSIYRLKQRR